jgi:hypothetical protein
MVWDGAGDGRCDIVFTEMIEAAPACWQSSTSMTG